MLPLPDSAITLGATAPDWISAVLLAGEALSRSGTCTEEYGPRMVAMVEEFGAYIVIAPGLALAHARPGPDVLSSGMAVVTLAEPVVFGHPYNDPVSVVLGLAVVTADEHVSGIAELANVFNDQSVIERLKSATSIDEVQALLHVGGDSPGAVFRGVGSGRAVADAEVVSSGRAVAGGAVSGGVVSGGAVREGRVSEEGEVL